jgi:hypothetical protein
MLHKQFPTLSRDKCKHVIRACPTCSTLLPLGPNTGINPHGLKANHIWQTDVTYIPKFGTLKYVHVTVDIYSGVLFASPTQEKLPNMPLVTYLVLLQTLEFQSP